MNLFTITINDVATLLASYVMILLIVIPILFVIWLIAELTSPRGFLRGFLRHRTR